MIADKIIPSFYILNIEGAAVRSIIDEDCGLESIEIGSIDFTSDLNALNAVKAAMQYIVSSGAVDQSTAVEDVKFNPEFFPSLPKLTLTEEQQAAQDELDDKLDDMSEELQANDQVAVPITRNFDELGDFIETRWTVEGEGFKIVAKVGVNPEKYAQHKARELALEQLPLPIKSSISFH